MTSEGRAPSRFDRWLPIGLAALGPLLLFGPMLARGEVLYWGTPLLQFVPWRAYAFDLLRSGSLPLWNPLLGMGAPLLANYQTALLYPPNWILALTPTGWGEGLLVLSHLALAGAGTVLLLRRLRIGPLGQSVGGIAFASCSYLVARAGFFSLIAAAAYLPWLVLTADGAAAAIQSGTSADRVRATAFLAGVIALQALAGHAQTLAYALVFAVSWSIWRAANLGGGRAVVKVVAVWVLAAALGLAVAGAQILPTAEYLAESSRGGGLPELGALTYSFWPWRTLGLVLPGLFGSPVTGDYWGYGNYWEDALYVGVLALLMALTAALRAGRLGREAGKIRTFLLVVSAMAFILALGANTPVFPLLFRYVPSFDIFNAPTRITLIVTFCLAILAGHGAELWRRPTGRALYWTRLGTAGAAGVLVLGGAAALVPTGLRESFGRTFAQAGLWLTLAGALALVWPARVGRRWIIAVAAILTLDLVIAGLGLNPSTSASIYQGTTELASMTGDGHRLYLSTEADRVLKFDRTHRFDSFQVDLDPRWIRESGLPNTTMLDENPSASNFDPLLAARYVAWTSALTTMPAAKWEDALRLMDAGWVGETVGEAPPWITYRAVAGAQRAWLMPQARPAENSFEALQIASSPDFDLTSELVLEAPAQIANRQGGGGAARVLGDSRPDRVVIAVEAPSGGWLMLSDLWYPGWGAKVDGEPAESYPADGVFRAVWVPAGASTVTWEYHPASFRNGAALSIGGLLVFAGVAVLWIARRRSA